MNATDTGRLLLLGADRALLTAAQDLGFEATVIVGEETRAFGLAPVPPRFTEVVVPSTSDVEALLTSLFLLPAHARDVDAVVTSEEFAVVPAAVLAAHLGTRGPAMATALVSRDKAEQKRLLTAAGLHHRAFTVVEDLAAVPELPLDGGDPPRGGWVLKPLHGCATEATARVRTSGEWRAVRERFLADAHAPSRFILEEHVAGEEWQVDGVVVDGTIIFAALGRYERPCLQALDERQPVRTHRPGDEVGRLGSRVRDFAQRCLTALGVADGPFHLELFVAGEELVYGEFALRRGAGSVQEEVHAKWGVDLARLSLLAALGRAPEATPAPTFLQVASTDLPCDPGVVLDVPDIDALNVLPGVVEAWLEVPAGMTMPDQINTVYRLGSAVVAVPPGEDLTACMDAVVAWVRAHTRVVPPGATPADLRRLAAANPDARGERRASRLPRDATWGVSPKVTTEWRVE